MSASPSPAPPRSWVMRLASVCWERKRLSLIVLVASVSTITLVALGPLLTREAVNDALAGDFSRLPWLAAGLVAIAFLDFVGNYVRRNYAGELSLWVQHTLRGRVFDSIQKLDGPGQDALRAGQVISRTNSDLQQMHMLMQMSPVPLAVLTYYVVGIAVMLWMSPAMTMIVIGVIGGLAITGLRARRRVFAQTGSASDKLAQLTEHVREVLAQISVVKSCVAEAREYRWLDLESKRMVRMRIAAAITQAMPGATMLALPVLGQIALLCFGGWSVMHGRIDLGTFIAFASFLAMLTGPTRVFASFLVIAQRTRASVERVFSLIDTRPRMRDGSEPLAGKITGLAFDRVGFGYDDNHTVLREVSFTAGVGETIAIVGASGSGKSTLSLLVPRFYDPSSGGIGLRTDHGEQPLTALRLDELRRSVGTVFEDAFLFVGSVADNIAYGRPNATERDIRAAADAAGATAFVEALPKGFQTRLSDQGSNLSGGQRQRLALARALFTAPSILIVDDTTSAVDASTEAEINTALRRYADDEHMLLVIARRRSTLQLADRIIVLDGGTVADIGTHAELEARCPVFRTLLAGDSEFLDPQPTAPGQLWPAREPVPEQSHDELDATVDGLKAGSFRERMTRVPERATQLIQAGDGRRVASLLRPVTGLFLIAAALIVADTAAGVGVPMLLQRGIDHGVAVGNTSVIAQAALIALSLVVVSWCCYALQTVLATRAAETVQHTVRLRSFGQMLRLGLPYHEAHAETRLTRMTVDIDALARFLQNGLVSAATSLLTMTAIAVAMFVLDVPLALVALASVPVVALATVAYRRLSAPAYAQARVEIGKVNSSLQEKVSGLRVVQSHGQQGKEAEKLRQLSDRFRATRVRAQKYLAVYFPFLTFCTEASYAAVLLVGAWRVADGGLTAGVLAAFLLLLGYFYGPVQQLSGIVDSYQQATASSKHIDELLATDGTEDVMQAQAPTPEKLGGALTLDQLSFRYPGSEMTALDRLSLSVPAGSVVAVVGESGAGKSTLIKLLAGLYRASAGQIIVGGKAIDERSLTDYRARIGLVEQDVALFTGDIAENIRYARPSGSDAEIEHAARQTGLIETVRSLPRGFRTRVSNGGRDLSAGQRQLVALTRSELADADILLLDEATARLDRRAEDAVIQALLEGARVQGRTTLIVAHRLSTACRCDAIAVLAHGRLAEYGSHEQLLAVDGIYARLWRDSVGDAVDMRAQEHASAHRKHAAGALS